MKFSLKSGHSLIAAGHPHSDDRPQLAIDNWLLAIDYLEATNQVN
jgi:hypothetical protein